MSKFYELGKQFANIPTSDNVWIDIPDMTDEQRQEFHRGFDDASKESRIFANLFVAALVIITVVGLFGLVAR
jgi:hypothetical protein